MNDFFHFVTVYVNLILKDWIYVLRLHHILLKKAHKQWEMGCLKKKNEFFM